MNRTERRIIVAEARKLVRRVFPGVELRQACLYHAWAVAVVANKRDHYFRLQAGTAYWPCVATELDDGVSPNRFGYEYQPGGKLYVAQAELADTLPEMHVWAVHPAGGEIIDLTTGMWPAQARALQGIDWRATRPPDYLWCSIFDLPKGVVYEPSQEASDLAGKLLVRSLRGV
jgi:hypothetical protein